MRLLLHLALGLCALGSGLEGGEIFSGPAAFASPRARAEEGALLQVLQDYVRAIEAKDLAAFRGVKPNLSTEEEQRARKAFASVQSQAIVITVLSAEVEASEAVVKVSRRDTINKSIASSFPQTFTLARGSEGWAIQVIGR